MDLLTGIATMMIDGTKLEEVVAGLIKNATAGIETETAANQPAKTRTGRTTGIRSPYATKKQKKAGRVATTENSEKPAEIVVETKPEPEPEIDFVAALAAAKLEDTARKKKEEEDRLARIAKIKEEAEARKEAEKQEKIAAFMEAHEAWVGLKKQLQPALTPYVVNLSNLIATKKRAVEAREDATAAVMDKAIAKYKLLWGISAKTLGEALAVGFVPGDEFKKFVDEYKANEARRIRKERQTAAPQTPAPSQQQQNNNKPNPPKPEPEQQQPMPPATSTIAELLELNGSLQKIKELQNGNGDKALKTAEEIARDAKAVAETDEAEVEEKEIPVNGEK